MKAWRVLVAVSFLLLSGCLVTFKDPIPANEAAPIPLLGKWTREDEWGDQLYLDVSRSGANLYQALVYAGSPDNPEDLEIVGFTVAHHGRRWYLSAGVPKSLGGNFAIAGFELTRDNELVIYNLDTEHILGDMRQGLLDGETVEMPDSEGALITSPLSKVFAYLDNPANADLFVEVARYQRAAE
ncbi:conserved exported hypothetical protein [Pseudomonas sp. 8Z]|uniref:hypothetical protein n=1 Tax=Pseudomonas sp. 8Z TaxID=2653166 RepID=UPI0012F323B1|nr:hypothetical protein [Pseudomonas sp. 8Z]VXC76264.1 conserved exported hypothetical protein [Pseudomonas sp. 8Z]